MKVIKQISDKLNSALDGEIKYMHDVISSVPTFVINYQTTIRPSTSTMINSINVH